MPQTPHTWRLALPNQRCQERRCCNAARWVLTMLDSLGGEELLCGVCAPLVARQFGLSEPGEEVQDVG